MAILSSYKGNTSITVTSSVYNLPFKINFFNISNLNAGSTIITVSVTDGVTDILLSPQDLVLSQGDMLEGTSEQIIDAGNQIKIVTDNTISYYFTIENIIPEPNLV